jgi:group I intron endonuclease
MGFIYKITNIISNKCYIGLTSRKRVEDRWKNHKHSLTRGNGCFALQQAVNMHGFENFKFEVIEECLNENFKEREMYFIKQYNSIVPNGYNTTKGGEIGCTLGKKHEEKTKNILQEKTKEYFSNFENIEKQRAAMAKSVGLKLQQLDKDKNVVHTFNSAAEAARQTNISKSTIKNGVRQPDKLKCGFYWKLIE